MQVSHITVRAACAKFTEWFNKAEPAIRAEELKIDAENAIKATKTESEWSRRHLLYPVQLAIRSSFETCARLSDLADIAIGPLDLTREEAELVVWMNKGGFHQHNARFGLQERQDAHP